MIASLIRDGESGTNAMPSGRFFGFVIGCAAAALAADWHDDEVTRETVRRVQEDGTCWLGGTVWHGVAAMRISVSNWRTTREDVERSVEAILRCAAVETPV